MNEGFFKLPEERQQEIINAGFKVFARHAYKKAPVAEIAAEAGISKALLFYHFRNKEELYLYLWEKSLSIITEESARQQVLDTEDFFEMLSRSLKAKCNVIRNYPYMMEFAMRAYYERSPEVADQIHGRFDQANRESLSKVLARVDKSKFIEGIDFFLMYQEMIWAADGYMRNAMLSREMKPEKIEQDYEGLIEHWRKVYLK